MPRVQLAPVEEILPNTPRSFGVGGKRLVLVNLDGAFYALDDLCPHLAVPLSRGEMKDGCLVCPGHGSVFDVKTGAAVRWVGKAITFLTRLSEGRPVNARCYPCVVEDGQVMVEL